MSEPDVGASFLGIEDPKRMVRYAVVGVSVAGLYAALFLALHQWLGMREWSASVIAYGVAVAYQYLAQTFWTFRKPIASRDQALKFAATIALGASFSTLVTGFAGPALGVPDVVNVGVVVTTLPFVNYQAFRLWVYPDTKT